MRVIKIHTFLLLLAIFCSVGHNIYGQKIKGKKGKTTEASLREAEFYFTEGEKYYILEDYAKALVLFQKSLEINGENATVHYKIAQILSKGNELQKALENVKEAIRLDADNKYFYVLAAEIYSQLGDFENASTTYEGMIGRLDNTEQYLFELAALYLYQGRYDDALGSYDKIEKAYGLSEEVIFQKQKIHLQTNNLEQALAEGQKLVDAFPGEEPYVLKQVEILLSNDKLDEAKEILEKHITSYPQGAQARLMMAGLKRKEGDLEGARKDLMVAFQSSELSAQNKIQLLAEYRMQLKKEELEGFGIELAKVVVQVHPDVADAHAIYGDILQTLGKTEPAKNQYKHALELDNSNFNIWQNILQLYLELNRLDSVIIVSEEALELFPNQGSLYYYNGAANLQQRNYEEAVPMLEQGKKLSSSNLGLVSVFNGMLGDAYNGLKNYAKSDVAYEAALDFDPDNYVVLNNYSYYLALRREKLEKAEKMSAKVVKNNPTNATYIDTYAWVLYMREKYKEAKKVMEKAFKEDPDNVTAIHYEHYGDILFKLGDIDAAVKNWRIAKGLNPNAELIDQKIADRKLYEQ
ncbi:MAG: tetratricopeptide repeat protein [Cytophagales bacterium]|nr:tetratricopeptide repeat protein [Cytophagales bacterium]